LEITQEIKESSTSELLEYICWKEEFPIEAGQSFVEFCLRFDNAVKKRADIACLKWNKTEDVALDVVRCTFRKVWKYPTYNHSKSKANDFDKGVLIWLSRIVYTQLSNFHKNGFCYEPDEETDLSLIYDIDELSERISNSDEERKSLMQLLNKIDMALAPLSEKHKTIFLTYRLYERDGRYIPRSVTKKLREELNLTQGSIRKYKEDALKMIRNYLKPQND